MANYAVEFTVTESIVKCFLDRKRFGCLGELEDGMWMNISE